LGTPIDGADLQVNTTVGGLARRPAVASDPSGNYAVVVWENTDGNGLTSRILARRFQGASAIGGMSDLTLDASPAATRQHHPAVAHEAIGYRAATLLPPIASTAATRDSLLGSSLNTWGGWPGR
jgi:hypothetical protein